MTFTPSELTRGTSLESIGGVTWTDEIFLKHGFNALTGLKKGE
jgi:hypothetical protein